MTPHLAIAVFLVIGIGFGAGGYIASWFLRRDKPNPLKNIPYECGEETVGRTWVQFHVGYYVIALIFVVFDVETIFLVPWAVAFKALGFAGLVAMAVFIGILLLGLAWVWKKGALSWL